MSNKTEIEIKEELVKQLMKGSPRFAWFDGELDTQNSANVCLERATYLVRAFTEAEETDEKVVKLLGFTILNELWDLQKILDVHFDLQRKKAN